MEYPRHLLQSPAWAQFREKWATKVVKVGQAQFTVHPIPHTPWSVGYMPRPYPEDIDWQELTKKAKEENCIYVKIEPNSKTFTWDTQYDVRPGDRMFAYATYFIDLGRTEEELLAAMHHKTRYNIRLATRKGVTVKIGHSKEMLDEFLALFHETAKRHTIFLHPDRYYEEIFSTFNARGEAEIVTGYFEGQPLASMMLLSYKDTMFYPYGGSTHEHKDTMAFTLVMWESIRFSKEKGYKYFDMWNCLPPEQEKPDHPWYGFHRFKKGFNGELVQFPGAFDYVLNPVLYPLFILLNKARWGILYLGQKLKLLHSS